MGRMDEIVKQAMRRWPNVPHCFGWLALDARGDWWMRDARAQACGSFTSGAPGAKGARLLHAGLRRFLARNYQVSNFPEVIEFILNRIDPNLVL